MEFTGRTVKLYGRVLKLHSGVLKMGAIGTYLLKLNLSELLENK